MKRRLILPFIVLAGFSMGIFLITAHGEEYKYFSKGKRDPFVPLATGEIKTSMGLQAVETIDDVKFEGIIFDPNGKSMVVLNDEVLKEGDKLYNVEIIKIDNKAVTIKVNERVHTINLVEEGGGKS